MLGFGKKKLDEKMLGMISVELSMFMRWMEENCSRMLMPEEAKDIAARILDRENFQFCEKDTFHIAAIALASDVERIDELRNKMGFDKTIDGFCQSIGITKPT